MSNSTFDAVRPSAVTHDGRVLKVTVKVQKLPAESMVTDRMRADYEQRRRELARKVRKG